MTDVTDSLDEIKKQLAHPYIRERQAALEKIRELLDKEKHVRWCVETLKEVSQQNEYLIVAEKAKDILSVWQRRSQVVKLPDDRKHMFGVICPKCGHQNYYDKRKVCGSQGSIFMGLAEDLTDELLLTCQADGCNHSFVVRVNCEGYK